jgi:hypothetical protein
MFRELLIDDLSLEINDFIHAAMCCYGPDCEVDCAH